MKNKYIINKLFAGLLFLAFIAGGTTNKAMAQSTNLDLETWGAGTYSAERPLDWGTFNFDNFGFPASTVPITTNPAEGDTSAQLFTQSGYDAIFGAGSGLDTLPGMVALGGWPYDGVEGMPYTQKPSFLNLQYKAFIADGDTALIYALLRQGQTTVATAFMQITDTTSNWITATIPFNYQACNTPDTIEIYAMSSQWLFMGSPDPIPGSELHVDSFTLDVPPVPTLTLSQTNPSCPGACDGSATATVTGGFSTNYSYFWDNGQSTQTATGLCEGTTSITIFDGVNCVVDSVVLVDPAPISVTGTGNDASCNGVCDGSIDITVSGGTSPYTFLWSNGETTEDLANLCAGTLSGTVTDAAGCTSSGSFTITEPSAITVSLTSTDESSCGAGDGSVNSSVTGGSTPYSYNWSNGATTQNISSLTGGNYTLTVTDGSGCTQTASAVVNSVGGPTITVDSTDIVSCNGGNDGAAYITATGGTTPYSFTWSNGATTEDATGLAAGVHTVQVDDSGGCTSSASVTVTEPNEITGESTVTDESACGAGDGAIDVFNLTGGTGAYSFAWSNGATTQDLTGLSGGIYTITVTDDNGCTATNTDTVNTIGAPSVTVNSVTDVACVGAGTGAIDITVSGGTTPYVYEWSNGATTEDISGLDGGTYTVTITDNNGTGCSIVESATVNEPAAALSTSTAVTDESADGALDGAVDLTVNGGTAPYTHLWSTGATTEDISGLDGGNYTVTVTDAQGCTATETVDVADGSNSIAENIGAGSFKIYPNPNNGSFAVQFENAENGNYSITVKNILGQVVHFEKINVQKNMNRQMNLSDINKGLYFITVANDKEERTEKIMIK